MTLIILMEIFFKEILKSPTVINSNCQKNKIKRSSSAIATMASTLALFKGQN